MPFVRLGASGGLLAVSDGVFLKVDSGLAAQGHHAFRLGRLGFNGPDPLKLPEEWLYLGPPIVLIRLKRHLHRRFAVAGAVLDLRQVGYRLHKRLDVFTAT
jgi:hypothetical protein